jgi:CheY-like chemotaxis protein
MSELDFTTQGSKADKAGDAVPTDIGAQRPGKGANSIVYVRGNAKRAEAAPDAPVLVVEDDEVVRQLIGRILQMDGYPVRSAADNDQFIQALRQRPMPRLILLDVELPRINGFRILNFLRQEPQTSAIPVIMVTARSENKDLLQGLSLGADGFLSKPVSVEALRTAVAKVLGGTT